MYTSICMYLLSMVMYSMVRSLHCNSDVHFWKEVRKCNSKKVHLASKIYDCVEKASITSM